MKLSNEAIRILTEAALNNGRRICVFIFASETQIVTNKGNLMPANCSAKTRAAYEHAIKELERHDLIQVKDHRRTFFDVTNDGYKMAENYTIG